MGNILSLHASRGRSVHHFMDPSRCAIYAQRLKAERELSRDLREAEATESREKKSKLVSVCVRRATLSLCKFLSGHVKYKRYQCMKVRKWPLCSIRGQTMADDRSSASKAIGSHALSYMYIYAPNHKLQSTQL